MKKRGITRSLAADTAEAVEHADGHGLSGEVNRVGNAAVSIAHRQALIEWLEELNAEHGSPTMQDYADADAFLHDAFGFDT